MEIFYYKLKLAEYINKLKANGKSLGFAPTMGALHQGHVSLIKAAKNSCDLTISSIFVNPKQFNNQEDLKKYPRTEDADIAKLTLAGCDLVYIPSNNDLYDEDYQNIQLDLGVLANYYEGEKRPGHFEGVVQVLYQLFDTIAPDEVFFGQKDYQQCMVVNKLIKTYFPSIKMNTVPTLRDEEGLALSSRNSRLTPKGIEKARLFNKALSLALDNFNPIYPNKGIEKAISYLEQKGFSVEYLDYANAEDLTPCALWETIPNKIIVVAAVFLENIRLIDNKLMNYPPK